MQQSLQRGVPSGALRWDAVADRDEELQKIREGLRAVQQEEPIVATERLAAHLHIAVFPIEPFSRNGQLTDTIYHSFPVDVNGWTPAVATGTTANSSKPVKFKKQWCVLDGHTLSYYRSGSMTSIQGSIVISSLVKAKAANSAGLLTAPSCGNRVELILPPYINSSSALDPTRRLLAVRFDSTNGEQGVAVSSVLSIFCETVEEKNRWEAAIRNRINMSTVDI